jgi:hypothetical protein
MKDMYGAVLFCTYVPTVYPDNACMGMAGHQTMGDE